MLMSDDQVSARLGSLDNLFNRLHGSSNKNEAEIVTNLPANLSRYGDDIEIPSLPPSIDSLVDGMEEKLKIAQVNNAALDILNGSLIELKARLCEVESPKDLSRIATDMGKIINGGKENKQAGNINQVIIYKPAMSSEHHYETIVAAHEA